MTTEHVCRHFDGWEWVAKKQRYLSNVLTSEYEGQINLYYEKINIVQSLLYFPFININKHKGIQKGRKDAVFKFVVTGKLVDFDHEEEY